MTRARVTLVCGLLAFVAIQVGLPLIAGPDNIAVRDPVFDIKLAKLQERLKEHPQRPLILVLGSSRGAAGIRPDVWQTLDSSDQRPMVFNFAMAGVGPRQQNMFLQRLLSKGIHPDGVLIEILPAWLNQTRAHNEDQAIKQRGMHDEELAILYGQHSSAQSADSPPNSVVANHWTSLRRRVLRRFMPAWIETDVTGKASPKLFTEWGWRPFAAGVTVAPAEEFRRGLERARFEFGESLTDWEATDVADRALRQLLETCRTSRISAALYLMPEATTLREFYSPRTRTDLSEYLAAMSRDYGAPVLDATEWSEDQDFFDGFHLLADGATRFTQRFCREFLVTFADNLRDPQSLSQGPANQRQ